MKRLYHRMAIITLFGFILGCAPAAPPAGAPSPASKVAPTVAPATAPTTAPAAAPKPAPAAAPTAAPAAKPKSSVSFAGKSITILVPYTAGGDGDITARQVTPFLGRYLPGNPSVIVQNMPGAGGLVGSNWVNNVAPKDGTFIGQPSTPFAGPLYEPEQVKFDITKIRWLGGVGDTSVFFARADLGIKSAEELPRLGQKVFIGTTTIGSQRNVPAIFFMGLLGADFENVAGYGGAGDQRAAILRGEVHLTTASLPSYYAGVKPLVEQGQIVPLAQSGTIQDGRIVRDPTIPDIPTYAEILVKLKGEAVRQTVEYRAMEFTAYLNGLQRGWTYAPGVSDEVFALVAGAFEKVFADPEYIREFEKSVGYKPAMLNSTQAQALATGILERSKRDPQALEIIKNMARE